MAPDYSNSDLWHGVAVAELQALLDAAVDAIIVPAGEAIFCVELPAEADGATP